MAQAKQEEDGPNAPVVLAGVQAGGGADAPGRTFGPFRGGASGARGAESLVPLGNKFCIVPGRLPRPWVPAWPSSKMSCGAWSANGTS